MMKKPLVAYLFLASILSLFLAGQNAESQQLNYHGRIVDGITNLGVAGTRNFKIQVRTPSGLADNCLMYEESVTKNLVNGVFVITLNNGAGVRTDVGGTLYTVQQIFSNKNTFGSFSFVGSRCTSTNPFTYTPTATANRRIYIYFEDPIGAPGVWEPLPTQTVAYVPGAIEALNVGGFSSDALFRTVDALGNPTPIAAITPGQYSNLMSIATGTFVQNAVPGTSGADFNIAIAASPSGSTLTFNIPSSSAANRGLLTPADWTTFNAKMPNTSGAVTSALGFTPLNPANNLSEVSNAATARTNLGLGTASVLDVPAAATAALPTEVVLGDDPRLTGAIVNGSSAGGDLSGTYPNPTVAQVGGQTAGQINTSVNDTIAATNLATAGTIVKRDGSGNSTFSSVNATNFSGNNFYVYNTGNLNRVQIIAPTPQTGGNYTLTLPPDTGAPGLVLGTNGAGVTSWINPSGTSVTAVTASPPLSSSAGFTPNISITQAGVAGNGYLSSSDWSTFNNKQTSTLSTGQVWVGNGVNVAAPQFLNVSNIQSSFGGNWFNVGGACAAGEILNYSPVTDQISCSAMVMTGSQVATALNGIMTGDATITTGGVITIGNGAVTNAKLGPIQWSKITSASLPTSIAGYGILDAILTQAGGVDTMQAGTFAARPAANAVGVDKRVYVAKDTQEIYYSDGVSWIKIGSINGLGGTVQSVAVSAPLVLSGVASVNPSISMPVATAAVAGYLSSSDFSNFAGKVNRAGDTMTGALNMGGNNITAAGNIAMSASKNIQIGAYAADPACTAVDAGKVWYHTPSNSLHYCDGTAVQSIGSLAGVVTGLNGLTGAVTINSGSTGSDLNIATAGATVTVNIPTSSAANRGLVSSADFSTFTNKLNTSFSNVSGTLGVANGGTGVTSVPTNGQLLIGNGTGYTAANITGTANQISVTNAAGSITLATPQNINAAAAPTFAGMTLSGVTGNTLLRASGAGVIANATSADITGLLGYVPTTNALPTNQIFVGNAGVATAVAMSGDASIVSSGVLTLTTVSTAGTYTKVTIDNKGRVTSATNILSSDVTTALGYTPLNKAGDTMSGALNMGGNNITAAGNIAMNANKNIQIGAYAADPACTAVDAGKIWYNTTGAGSLRYCDGVSIQSLGTVAGAVTSLNGLTGPVSAATGTTGTDFNITTSGANVNFNFPSASIANRGLLTSSDFSLFNSKQAGSTELSAIAALGTGPGFIRKTAANTYSMVSSIDLTNSVTGILPIANGGTNSSTAVGALNNLLPAQAGNANKFIQTDGAGNVTWQPISAVAVTSVTAAATANNPIVIAGTATAPTVDIPKATNTVNGYLSSADRTFFAAKLDPANNLSDVSTPATARTNLGLGSANSPTFTGATLSALNTNLGFVRTNGTGVLSTAILTSTDVTTALGYTPSSNALPLNQIFVGNAGGIATGVPMSGDASILSTGVVSLKPTGTAGTYGGSAAIPIVTTDSAGRVTTVTTTTYQDATGAAKGILSVGNNLQVAGGVISLQNATGALTGALTSADWTSFNNKLSTTLPTGQVWVGAAGVAVPQFLNTSNIKSTVAGNWFNIAGACAAGEIFSYSAVNDQVTCSPMVMTGSQVATALSALMSGDGTITSGGTFSIANNAVTNAKILSLNWSKITSASLPTTIVGYGITDAILTNAGGVTSMQAGLNAAKPAVGTAGRMYVSTDTFEIYRDDGTTWVKVGSAIGSGGTVTSVTGTAPISVATGTSTPVVSMTKATAGVDGYLASADFTTFNNKLSNSLTNGNIWVGNAGNVPTAVTVSGDASISNTGALTLATVSTAGTYTKVTIDIKGRVTSATNIISSDVTTALGYTPVNRAGDTMSGALNMGGQNLTNTGVINMASNGNIQISNRAADPAGLVAADAGRTWYNTTSNALKYYDGTTIQTLGSVAGVVTGVNGITGNVTINSGSTGTDLNIGTAGSTVTVNIPTSSAANRGLLSSSDFTTFTNKLNTSFSNVTGTLGVANGGTGATTLTANQLLLGNGTGAVTSAGAMTNGQLLIGSTGVAPVVATLTGTANQVSVTNGAGTITLSTPQNIHSGASPTFTGMTLSGVNGNTLVKSSGAGILSNATSADITALLGLIPGTVTSITAGTGLTGGTITTSGTIGLGTELAAINGLATTGFMKRNASGSYSTVASIDLTNSVTGTLPITNGGTGLSATGANGNVMYVTGGAFATATPDTAGLVDKASVQTISGAKTHSGNLVMSSPTALFQLQDNTTNTISMRAPAVVTPYTMTWPAAVGSAGQVLSTSATGILSWTTASTGTVTNVSAAATAGNPIVVLTGTTTPTIDIPVATATANGYLGSSDFTTFNNKLNTSFSNVSGTLGLANGGTGATTAAAARTNLQLSSTDSVTFNGLTVATAPTFTSVNGNTLIKTNGSGVVSNATSADVTTLLGFVPASNALPANQIFVGSAGGVATAVAMSGDASIVSNGAITLKNTGTAGTYGGASAVPTITTDAAGRVTTVTTNAYQDATGVAKGIVQVGTNLQVAAGVISLQNATTALTGALTSTDWTTFNNKQSALGFTPLNPANNLSDVANAATSRTNLGLGTGNSPTFTGMTLSGVNGNTLVKSSGAGVLSNATSADITTLLGFVPGSISTIAVGTGMTGGGSTSTVNVGVNAELQGLSALAANGFVRRTAAGTYSTVASIDVTSQITGVTPIANGGTGLAATGANGNVMYVTGGAFATATPDTAGLVDKSSVQTISGAKTHSGNLVMASPAALFQLTDNTTNTISMRAPAAVTSYTMTWPNAVGTAGQVLTTSAAGVLSWTNAAAGTVTSVTSANADIGITATTSAPVLTLNSGLAASQIAKVGAVGIANNTVIVANGAGGLAGQALTNGQLLIGSTGAAPVAAAITGTANQITVTNGAGSITLATPQDIHAAASPTFTGLTLSGLSTAGFVKNSAAGVLSGGNSVALSTDVTGTLAIANGGTGAVTANAALNNLLPTQTGNNGKVLSTNGTNTSWTAAATGTVTNVSAAATAGNPIVVLTGTTTPTIDIPVATATANGYLSSADFSTFTNKLNTSFSNVSGTLGLANGGTGATTAAAARTNLQLSSADSVTFTGLTVSGVNGNTLVKSSGAGLFSNATSTDITTLLGFIPATSTLAANMIFVGNGSNIATAVAMSGDASIVSAGTITLKPTGTAGTYGSASAVPTITTDAAGRVTTVTTNAYQDATGATKGIVQVGNNLQVTSGTISLQNATAALTGALTSSDWSTFAAKLSATITTPTAGQLIRYNGASWVNGNLTSTDVTTGLGFTPLNVANNLSDVTNAATSRTNLGLGTASSPTFTGMTLSGLASTSLIKTSAGVVSAATSADVTTLLGFTPSSISSIAVGTGMTGGGNSGAVSVGVNTELQGLSALAANGFVRRTAAGTYSSVASIDLTNSVTGTLPVANGGTGAATLTANSLLVGNGTGAVNFLAPTNGNVIYGAAGAWASGTPNTAGLVDLTSAQSIAGNKTFSNNVKMASNTALFQMQDNAAGVLSMKATNATTSYTLSWPATVAASNGYVLASDTSGNLSWVSPTSGSVTSVTAAATANNPITVGGTAAAPTIDITKATAAANGYLTSSDFSIFAAKQAGSSELTAIAALGAGPGFIRKTAANTYSMIASIDISNSVTGLLPVANGGTGAATLTANSLLLGNGTGAVTAAGAMTNGQMLVGSTGVAPVVATVGSSNGISLTTGAGTFSIGTNATTATGNNTLAMRDGAGVVNANGVGFTNTGTVTISAGTASATYGLTLPVAQGAVNTVLKNNGAGVLTWASSAIASIDLTTGVSGILPVANGGTGISSGTSGGVPYFSAAGTIASSGVLTNKGIVLGGGAGGAPTTTAALTDGQLLIGSTGIAPVAATLTGTANQISVTTGAGSITLATPQNIHSGASPTFTGMTLSGLGSALVRSVAGVLSNATSADITSLLGAAPLMPANNLSDVANAATSRTNLGLGTGNSPSFTGLTLSGVTGNTLVRANGSGVVANATSADITSLLGFVPGVGTVTSVTAAATANNPIVIGGTAAAPTIDITKATAAANGYLTSSDFSIFAAKQTGSAELTAIAALGAGPGFIRKTAANTYSMIASIDVSTSVTGLLPVANGGTGAATLTTGSLLVGNGTGAVNFLAPTNGNVIYGAAGAWASGTPNTAGLVDLTNAQSIGGIKTHTTTTIIDNQQEIRFREATGGGVNYIGLRAPAALAADVTFNLPIADGTVGQVLKTDGAGQWGWVSAATGTVTSVTAAATANNPITIGGTAAAPTVDIPMATSAVNGYLSSTDRSLFFAKQAGSTELTAIAALGAGPGFIRKTAANTYSMVASVDVTTQITGITPIANGGTGAATATANTFFMGPSSGGAVAPSFRTIASLDISAIGFVNGGNSFAATANLGTADANQLNIKTSGSTRMSFDTSGAVQVTGQAYSNANVSTCNAGAATCAWDANTSNVIVYNAAAQATPATTITNMKPGGSYMLVVSGSGTGTATITCNGVAPSYVPANGSRINGTKNKSVYTLMWDGTDCLVTWITGF